MHVHQSVPSRKGGNGLYIKSGASGSGSWTQLTSFLPSYQFVTASPTGASTANSIVASTSPRLPAGDGVALVTLAIPATDTASPVTVRFHGGAVLTIKTRTAKDPEARERQQDESHRNSYDGHFRANTTGTLD